MKRKVLINATALTSLLLTSIPAMQSAAASSTISLQVDEKPFIANADIPSPYVNQDGRTMVPLRFISENMGASVAWNGDANQAMIQKGNTTIYVTVGLNQIVVNGSNVDMDTTAENTGGHVFIPARFIAEALGAEVDYNPELNKVFILSDKTNNFIAFGLKSQVSFPYTITSKGLKVTINNIHVYPVNSDEAQSYIKKYRLGSANTGTQYFFIWANVTLRNESDHDIGFPSTDWVHKWEINADGINHEQAEPGILDLHNTYNSPDYLWGWNLKTGESLTTNVAYFSNKQHLTYVTLHGYQNARENYDLALNN